MTKKKFNDSTLNKLMKAEKTKKQKADREKNKKMQIIRERIEAEKKEKVKQTLTSSGKNIYEINKKKIIDFMLSLKDCDFKEAIEKIKELCIKYENPTIKNYTEIDITKDPRYQCTYLLKSGEKCSKLRHLGKYCVKHVNKKKVENENEDEEEVLENECENMIKINFEDDEDVHIDGNIYNIFLKIEMYFNKILLDNLIAFTDENKYSNKDKTRYEYFGNIFNKFLNIMKNRKLYNINKKNIRKTSTTTPYSRKKILISNDKLRISDIEDSTSPSIYSNPPWIPYKVKNVYIHSDDFAVLSNVITSYDLYSDYLKKLKSEKYYRKIKNSKNIGYDIDIIEKNLIIGEDNQKWYKVNKKFFKLFDKITLFRKKQEGEVLTVDVGDIFEDFGDYKQIKFKIGFLIDDESFIIQNENIFNSEIEYFKDQKASKEQKIKKIFSQPLSKQIVELGSKILFEELQKITNLNQDIQYANDVVNEISSSCETVKEFAEKLADLLVYLNPIVEKIGNKIFKKKIITGYYKPEVLAVLSPAEKLPEIFNDSTSPKLQDMVAGIINNVKRIFVKNFVIYVYNEIYGTNDTREVIQSTGIKCENSDSLNNINSEEIVYYYIDETDKTYCFLIKDLLKQFRNNNYKIYIKNNFENGDNVEIYLVEKDTWVKAKIIDIIKYNDIYTAEYTNKNGDIEIIKMIKNKIRGDEGVFSKEFVKNFMSLYGNSDLVVEENLNLENNEEVQIIEQEEEVLVPNLLELIEQDISSIIGEPFKIISSISNEVIDNDEENEEIFVRDEGSNIDKKTGLPKRITDKKLFKKWLDEQKNKMLKKTKKVSNNYSPKIGASSCEDCGKRSGVFKTVGKKNKHMNLCLDCMENKDNRAFY